MATTITIGALELRRFGRGDVDDLYAVRNHESVRAFMADPRPLEYSAHVEWTRKNLLESDRIVLFVARKRGEPVGLTLLKRLSQDTAEIGVMFRDARRHRLAASEAAVATAQYGFRRVGFKFLVSYVVPGHTDAVSINRGFGGQEVPSDKPGMLQFRGTLEACMRNPAYRALLARIEPKMSITEG